MRLYYSGSMRYNEPQMIPYESLGGMMSSTPVPNNRTDLLFDKISESFKYSDIVVFRGLFIKNDTEDTLCNFRIASVVDENSIRQFTFAVVVPKVDNCGNISIEKIQNENVQPSYGEFFDCSSEKPSSILKVTRAASYGEKIKISIGSFELTTKPFNINNASIPQTANFIVNQFRNCADFAAIILDSSTHTQEPNFDSVKFVSSNIQPIYENLDYSSDGNFMAQTGPFVGGLDNSFEILEKFEPNAILGLWIGMTMDKNQNNADCDTLYSNFVNDKDNSKDSLSIMFLWD